MTEPRHSPPTDDAPGAGANGPAGTSSAWNRREWYGERSYERPPEYDDGYDASPPPPPRTRPWDLSPIFVLVDGLRRALPREVQAQFTGALRELLLTLRSLIDWYLDRLDGRRREPPVEDIPID